MKAYLMFVEKEGKRKFTPNRGKKNDAPEGKVISRRGGKRTRRVESVRRVKIGGETERDRRGCSNRFPRRAK